LRAKTTKKAFVKTRLILMTLGGWIFIFKRDALINSIYLEYLIGGSKIRPRANETPQH
jgi:hypothetical protein